MLLWIKSLFAWKLVHDTRAHWYYENTITGKRKVVDVSSGYQPVNWQWLEGGSWEINHSPLPGASCVKPPKR